MLLQVTHVVSQSDVVKLLWANKEVLGQALASTVQQLELDDVSHCPGTQLCCCCCCCVIRGRCCGNQGLQQCNKGWEHIARLLVCPCLCVK